MDFKDLLKFIDIEDGRLKKYYGSYDNQEKIVLARTVKITESFSVKFLIELKTFALPLIKFLMFSE